VPTADLIVSTFIEAVIAPAIEGAARDILARKINMRVVTADFTALRSGGVEVRSVLGAVLAQERDRVTEAHQPWTPSLLADGLRVVTKRQPTAQEWEALRFAWRICAHVKSNTVVFTDARRTLAIGAGQMSRVDAVNVAVMKARAPSARWRDRWRHRTRISLPRWPRGGCRRRCDRRGPAWRFSAGRRGDRGRRST